MKKCTPAFVHRPQAEERPGAGLKGATQYTPRIFTHGIPRPSTLGAHWHRTLVYCSTRRHGTQLSLHARARVELNLRRHIYPIPTLVLHAGTWYTQLESRLTRLFAYAVESPGRSCNQLPDSPDNSWNE